MKIIFIVLIFVLFMLLLACSVNQKTQQSYTIRITDMTTGMIIKSLNVSEDTAFKIADSLPQDHIEVMRIKDNQILYEINSKNLQDDD